MTTPDSNKDYMDKNIEMINNGLQLVNDKLSYYATTDKELPKQEIFLFQNVIKNIQDCLADMKDGCDCVNLMYLEVSLDTLNYYYQRNPLSPKTSKRRRGETTTNAHKEPTTEISEEKKLDIIKGLDFLFD